MKLTGTVVRFRANGAGAFFTEVEFTGEAEEVGLGTANDDRAKRFVDPGSRGARITARGYVDDTSNANFIDACQEAQLVEVTDLTGIDQARIDFYGPWQCLRSGLRHGTRTASEDSIELIGTGGAIPADFDPDTYVAPGDSSGT